MISNSCFGLLGLAGNYRDIKFLELKKALNLAIKNYDLVDLSLDENLSRIPMRLKELAIITVGRVFGSDYEWFIHAKRAAEFGIDTEVIESIRQNSPPSFTDEDEALVYDVARELAQTRHLADVNYRRAHKRFGDEGMVELAALVGFYHTVSIVLNVFDVEAPEGDPHPLKG